MNLVELKQLIAKFEGEEEQAVAAYGIYNGLYYGPYSNLDITLRVNAPWPAADWMIFKRKGESDTELLARVERLAKGLSENIHD